MYGKDPNKDLADASKVTTGKFFHVNLSLSDQPFSRCRQRYPRTEEELWTPLVLPLQHGHAALRRFGSGDTNISILARSNFRDREWRQECHPCEWQQCPHISSQ